MQARCELGFKVDIFHIFSQFVTLGNIKSNLRKDIEINFRV